jgi:hypothetical protein
LKSRGTITFLSLGGPFLLADLKGLETAAGIFELKPALSSAPVPLEEAELNAARKQYDAAAILKRLEGLVKASGSNFVIGVTEKDLYVQGSNDVFGLADPQRPQRGLFLRKQCSRQPLQIPKRDQVHRP